VKSTLSFHSVMLTQIFQFIEDLLDSKGWITSKNPIHHRGGRPPRAVIIRL
jgi:hypothetical protein